MLRKQGWKYTIYNGGIRAVNMILFGSCLQGNMVYTEFKKYVDKNNKKLSMDNNNKHKHFFCK